MCSPPENPATEQSTSRPPWAEEEVQNLNEQRLNQEFDRWITALQESDRAFYKLMAIEVWTIAKTMDGILPGFWSRFMANRQVAMKNFLTHKHTTKGTEDEEPSSHQP